ncbi:MAG: FAD-dependent oxidoreductase [Actinomycetota bacterium]|nr:FAD-dependent oxidoreductase [Actinomycetota bacterium]
MRVAVIGAGVGGLVATWLLSHNHEVVCFEGENCAGGNARPEVIRIGSSAVPFQLGPTYFLPKNYSTLFAIFRELDIATERTSMRLSVVTEDGQPSFISPGLHPLRVSPIMNRKGLENINELNTLLRRTAALLSVRDTATTWSSFIREQSVSEEFLRSVILPIGSAFFGVPYEKLGGISASSVLLYMALALPSLKNGFQIVRGVTGGTDAWIRKLCKFIPNETLRLGQIARGVNIASSSRVIVVHDEGEEAFDHVVVAAQPWSAAELISDKNLATILRGFPSFESEIAIHMGPLLELDPNVWSPSTVIAGEDIAQLTTLANNEFKDGIYRSWVTDGPIRPTNPLYKRTYRHLLQVPQVTIQQRKVREESRGGPVHFAGAWTRDVDSHEAAVRSGVEVARQLGSTHPFLSRTIKTPNPYNFGDPIEYGTKNIECHR